MAEIAVTTIYPTTRFSHGAIIFTWLGVTDSDTLEILEAPGHSDVSVQMAGSFEGGNCSMQGSNIGAGSFVTMQDLDGADITLTASTTKIVTIRENVRYYQPSVPTGSGASITITLLAKAVR